MARNQPSEANRADAPGDDEDFVLVYDDFDAIPEPAEKVDLDDVLDEDFDAAAPQAGDTGDLTPHVPAPRAPTAGAAAQRSDAPPSARTAPASRTDVAGGTTPSATAKPSAPKRSTAKPATAPSPAARPSPSSPGEVGRGSAHPAPAASASRSAAPRAAAGRRPSALPPADAQPQASQPSSAPVGYEILPTDESEEAAPPERGYALLGTEPAPAPAAPAGSARRKLLRVAGAAAAALVLAGTGFVVYDRTLRADSSVSTGASTDYERARQRAASRRQAQADAQRPAPDDSAPPLAPAKPPAVPEPGPTKDAAVQAPAAEASVEIGIAYGTEKRRWLEWATTQFAAAEEGRGIRVHLIPMGSLESAHAILDGDQRIHVWAPASSLYRESLVRDWEAKHEASLIRKEEPLALTPMVLVMWKKRYEVFTASCPELSLRTVGFAMHAPGGWQRIAGKPEWGRFKFGHTHPNQSNSGLMTLILMAYESCEKTSGLTVADIMSPKVQEHLTRLSSGVTGLSHSTGTMMKEMVLKGPASYDVLMVYESVALEYLESAAGRWDQLRVVYPRHNLWNDNPYCILQTPWTTSAHQRAAEKFLAFLLSEPIQLRALEAHGFRPGNPSVPVNGPRSPLVRFADYGVRLDLPDVCDVPSREVLENLQQAWLRCAVSRGSGRP